MPCAASSPAAVMASATIRPIATMVQSLPGRAILAWPNGIS